MSIASALASLRRTGIAIPLAIAATAATAIVALPNTTSTEALRADEDCPPGYERMADIREPEAQAYAGRDLNGPAADAVCVTQKRPEPFAEVLQRQNEFAQIQYAPYSAVQPGAQRAALLERMAAEASGRTLPGTAGKFEPYGQGPLQSNDPRFGPSALGIYDANGRVDDLEYYPNQGFLFAAVGSGGVWLSRDNAQSWEDIGKNLPTQSVGGGVAYTTAHGGRILVLTGDGSFGGIAARNGVGVFYSDDMGATWQLSEGVPDLALGFAIETDPSDQNKIYAATFKGLFVSTDGGTTFANANLPTGDCAGVVDTVARPECHLANVVTDVVVQTPGGSTDAAGGKVMAAVGWRAGNKTYPDGETVESPNNGLYYSESGAPDSFSKLAASGFTEQDRIGRVEFGLTIGPEQNHEILYAVVEDAVLFNGGTFAPELDDPAAGGTVFNGLYASMNFGQSWTLLASGADLNANAGSGSGLNGVATALGVAPGVQAWYNLHIHPDPTRQQGGVPTRLVFGLEEVWQNEAPLPQNQRQQYKVIGRYFSGTSCMLLTLGAPVCPTNRGAQGSQTTHPDQHTAVWVPDGEGGVTLHVGNDGGIYSAFSPPGFEFDNGQWGASTTVGMNTMLPYDATIAADGVAYAGYQDNGTSITEYDGRAHMWNGGDGFFAGVDPDNSCRAYGESQNAGLRGTNDCGRTSVGMAPPITNVRFSTPFEIDPLNGDHIVVVGNEVAESLGGPGTSGSDWNVVFDSGTASKPGDPDATASADDPAAQVTAIDLYGDNIYAGFCAPCDVINQTVPFTNGFATNVGGLEPPESTTTKGWHVTAANGLPKRYITSIAVDRANPAKVYVALGGYSRRWYGPGVINDTNDDVGEGHLFVSTDAGENFTDISGNLPDTPIYWVETRGDQVIVGTEFGTFLTAKSGGTDFIPLPGEKPTAPISTLEIQPSDPDKLVIATFGRGIYTYTFDDKTIGPDVERVNGRSRVETAVAISQEKWTSAGTVVIARADGYADALTGAPLAKKLNAPILLSASGSLSPEVAAEIGRLGAKTAVVLGGPGALSPAVEDGLRAAGATTVRRLAGDSRFTTAAAIAADLGDRSGKAYLVKGNDEDPTKGWPDALAVAPVAAFQGRPILLTETDALPAATAKTLADRGINSVTIIGGEGVVKPEVATDVAGRGVTLNRVAGATRYETSAKVADLALAAGMSPTRLWFATGGNFPDALAAGPAAAKDGTILLLVDRLNIKTTSTPTRDWVKANNGSTTLVRILGGYKAIAQAVEIQTRSIWTRPDKPLPPPLPEAPEGEVIGEWNWDTGAEGWVVETVKTGDQAPTLSGWEHGCAGSSGIGFCVQPYSDETVTALISPPVENPGGGPVFVQWDWYQRTEECCDFFAVDVSQDGKIWDNVYAKDGENPSGYGVFDTGLKAFHSEPGQLYVRFRVSSDQLVFDAGVAVDQPKLLR